VPSYFAFSTSHFASSWRYTQIVAPPTSPILVRIIGPPSDALTLGDVLLGALGLTGAITVAAMVLGIVLGGVFILYRRSHPHNHFNGESSDEMSLKLG
jgi:ABC-type amino acid transport system permease subunit